MKTIKLNLIGENGCRILTTGPFGTGVTETGEIFCVNIKTNIGTTDYSVLYDVLLDRVNGSGTRILVKNISENFLTSI